MRSTCLPLSLAILTGRATALRPHQRAAAVVDAEEPHAVYVDNSGLHDGPPVELPQEEGDQQPESLIAMQFSDDPHAGRDKMAMILTGELGLAGVRIGAYSLDPAQNTAGERADVWGEFCAYDSAANHADPAAFSTHAAIVGASEHCAEHAYTMDLREVMAAVDAADGALIKGSGMKRLPLEGMVFHEGYSGAGLVSNALATFDSVHVVAEHAALRDALTACDVVRNRYQTDCSPALQEQLVKDVVTLLSRTPSASGREHLYLKMASGSAAYLPQLRGLYPSAKWVFVYRNPDHALAKAMERSRKGPCLKARRNPTTALASKSAEHGLDLEALSHHEVCALQLSTLVDAAANEHDHSGTGMLISYDDVILNHADAIVDEVLPYLGLGKEIAASPEEVKARVSEVLATRSNVHSQKTGRSWDGEEVEVAEEVSAASGMYLRESMDMLKMTSAS